MLFDDVYEYIHIYKYYWGENYEIQMKKDVRSYNSIKKIIKKGIIKVFNLFFRNSSRDMILILGFHNIEHFVEILYKKYDIVTNISINVFKKHLFDKVVFLKDLPRWNLLLYQGYFKKTDSNAMLVIDEMKDFLSNYNIRVLLLANDILFLNRCLAIAARELKIPVITIQHGIFTPLQLEKEGLYSNRFWCWSQYIKEEYIKQYKVSSDFVKVIGYPYQLPLASEPNKNRVLFAGVPYNRYDPKKYDEFIEVVKIVAKICARLKLKFVYRPHPSEIIQNKKFVGITISKEKDFFNDISNSIMLIGDISSTMNEAALVGRNVLQVIWNDDVRKIAELPMYHFTEKTTIAETDIERGIKKVLSLQFPRKPDDYYLHFNENFAECFLESIEEMVENDRR